MKTRLLTPNRQRTTTPEPTPHCFASWAEDTPSPRQCRNRGALRPPRLLSVEHSYARCSLRTRRTICTLDNRLSCYPGMNRGMRWLRGWRTTKIRGCRHRMQSRWRSSSQLWLFDQDGYAEPFRRRGLEYCTAEPIDAARDISHFIVFLLGRACAP